MAEQGNIQEKQDQAAITKELLQQSAEVKKKAAETNKVLDELKEKAQELLHPDQAKPVQ